MKRAAPFALSPAHSVDVPSYHSTGEPGRFLAEFPSGARVAIEASRQRAYPGLDGPAPQTAAMYQAASSSLAGARAVWDVGTGAGYGAALLATAERRVWGFDSDATALEFACHLTPQVRFARLPGEHHHLPEPDAMVLVDVLSVTEDPRALLWHLRRLAPPGCRLVIAEPSVGERDTAPSLARVFDEPSLRRLLLLAGWQLTPELHHQDGFVLALAECGDRSLGAHYQAAQRALEREALTEASRFLEQLSSSRGEPAAVAEARLLLTYLALQGADAGAAGQRWRSALEAADVGGKFSSLGLALGEARRDLLSDDQPRLLRAWQLAASLDPADPLTLTRLFTAFSRPQHQALADDAWQQLRAGHPDIEAQFARSWSQYREVTDPASASQRQPDPA